MEHIAGIVGLLATLAFGVWRLRQDDVSRVRRMAEPTIDLDKAMLNFKALVRDVVESSRCPICGATLTKLGTVDKTHTFKCQGCDGTITLTIGTEKP